MRVLLLCILLTCASAASAQTQDALRSDGVGAYRLGMPVAEAASAWAQWERFPASGDSGFMQNGPKVTIGEREFHIETWFDHNAVNRIDLFYEAAPVTEQGCQGVMRSVIETIEPQLGAFSAPANSWQTGVVAFENRTVAGSIIRTYASDEVGCVALSRANRDGVSYIEVESESGVFAPMLVPLRYCQIKISLFSGERLSAYEALLPPPTANDIAHAPDLPRGILERPPGWMLEAYYPRAALNYGVAGRAVLHCIAAADGRLACRVNSEEPAGAGFGEAARKVSSGFRVPLEVDGKATAGQRIAIPVRFQTN